jgi:hypothetical protein
VAKPAKHISYLQHNLKGVSMELKGLVKLGEKVSISSSLYGDVPIMSSQDYRLWFSLVVPESRDEKTRVRIGEAIRKGMSELQYDSAWGDNNTVINFSISDRDKSGICKYLVDMFEGAGLHVAAMGGSRSAIHSNPPHLADSPEPRNLPRSFQDFEAFRDFVNAAVANALEVSQDRSDKNRENRRSCSM